MLWEYLVQYAGEILMVLIGICSIVSLAIFLERFFYLNKIERENSSFTDQLFTKVNQQEMDDAIHFCNESTNIVSSNMAKIILKNPEKNSRELKEGLEDLANREIPKLETKIPALGTIASIAPLLGLLGTVLGMIDSLRAMQTGMIDNSSLQNTSRLLEGIWTALRTTAAGLIVAIPTLTAYNYLVTKVNGFITSLKNNFTELIDIVSNNNN